MASQESIVTDSVASTTQSTEQQYCPDLVLSRDELLNLFTTITERENVDVPLTDLIQLLGGIHIIMKVMLQAPNHNMSKNERIKMQQLLRRYSSQRVLDVAIPDVPELSDRVHSHATQDVEWILEPKNNALHDISPHLEKFIFSKAMLFILMLLAVPIMLLQGTGIEMEIFTIVVTWFCFIPWNIAALMSVNREMIPRIVATVDTWIKTVTMIITMVYTLIYNILSNEEPLILHIVFFIGAATNLSFLIIVVCSIDGIHQWGTTARIFLVMIVAAFALFWSVIFHFFAEDCVVTISALGDWSSFSIRDRVATAWEILFIFLWKQAFLTWRRHKNRCIVVRYARLLNGKINLKVNRQKPDQNRMGWHYGVLVALDVLCLFDSYRSVYLLLKRCVSVP